MTANELRKNIILSREVLDEKTVLANSQKVTAALFSTDGFLSHDSYFVYKSFRGEIDTGEIIAKLTRLNKTVLFPVTVGNELIAALPTGNQTTRDKFGVEIPLYYTEFNCPDVTIVPLVACDERGNRVGFGKGYYDRFFTKNECLKIGVCHDFQVVSELAPKPWDIPLDLIITEKRVILP